MCPLCSSKHILAYHSDKKRDYLQCQRCHLVFVAPDQLPTLESEKREYDLHENNFDDPGYIDFLSRVLPHLPFNKEHNAIDYGCGPSPVLATLLTPHYGSVSYYDPIYHKQTSVLDVQYDVITCTEAIEHCHTPIKEWQWFNQHLSPMGSLVLMTKRVVSQERFAQWHYKNDITHVSFFSETTFCWLANVYNMTVNFPTGDIAVFRKR